MTSNFVSLHLGDKDLFCYRTSYEFKEGMIDTKGENWKTDVQASSLMMMYSGGAPEEKRDVENCILLGQFVVTWKQLPKPDFSADIQCRDATGARAVVRVSFFQEPVVNLKANPDWFLINNIVATAVKVAYPYPVGPSKYINLSIKDNSGTIVLFRGVSPTACETTIDGHRVTALQVAAVTRVGTTQNCHEACKLVFQRKSGKDAQRIIAERFKGVKAATMYGGSKGGAVYRIVEPDFKLAVTDKFKRKDKTEVSYAEYFQQRYNIALAPNQVFLKCRAVGGQRSRPVHIPSQCLFPLTLDDDQKQQLPQLCSIFPQDRIVRTHEILNNLHSLQDDRGRTGVSVLAQFGLTIGRDLLAVKGKVMPPVEVKIPSGESYRSVNTGLASNQKQLGFARDLSALNHGATAPAMFRLISSCEARDVGPRGQVVSEVASTLNQMRSHGRIEGTPQNIEAPNGDHVTAVERNLASADPNKTLMLVNLHAKVTDEYKAVKSVLMEKGILSQVVAKDPANPIIKKMIAQQVSAKFGRLNWIFDVTRGSPSMCAPGKGLLIVGVDVASGTKNFDKGGRSMRRNFYVVAYVAFFVVPDGKGGATWHHYCNHDVALGSSQMLYRDSDAETGTTSAASEASAHLTAGTCSASSFPKFMTEALEHFGKVAPIHHVVVARGSVPDGEVEFVRSREVADLDNILQHKAVTYSYLAAQRKNNTRFCFDISRFVPRTSLPKETMVNPPRGFVTTESIPVVPGRDKVAVAQSGFYVNGANCTLGGAKSTKYLVLHHEPRIPEHELHSLLYGLCFLFPNKTDGLPYPLPLKCADKYANLFAVLDVSRLSSLPASLRPRMHYL